MKWFDYEGGPAFFAPKDDGAADKVLLEIFVQSENGELLLNTDPEFYHRKIYTNLEAYPWDQGYSDFHVFRPDVTPCATCVPFYDTLAAGHPRWIHLYTLNLNEASALGFEK
jgi:hypothetical protein